MNEWNDQAVVLKVGHFREIDLWLRLLVKGKGVLTALAFGGSKSKHRFCGCLEVLNTLQCRFRKSPKSSAFTLEEAALISAPRVLRKNWPRMGMAANCLRFLEALGPESCQNPKFFNLLEDLRLTLETKESLTWLFPLLFRFHLAWASGYGLDLLHCSYCQNELKDAESILEVHAGNLCCRSCQTQGHLATGPKVTLDLESLRLLDQVAHTLPSAWASSHLKNSQAQACARAIDGFIQYHLGIIWDKGGFKRI